MPEIELLPSSDEEEEQQEEVDVGKKEEIVTDYKVAHPASFIEADEKIKERHFIPFIHHPAAIRMVKRDIKVASNLKESGNELYKRKDFWGAVELYSDALDYVPDGEEHNYSAAVFLCNRAACFLALGKYEDVIEDCTAALDLEPKYVKALMRRAQAHEKMDEFDAALADVTKVVEIDPTFRTAVVEQARLDKIVKKKQEELKDEMMGKLKDLGNTILGKFGMSLDNFKAVQDPNTGSYSISFQQ